MSCSGGADSSSATISRIGASRRSSSSAERRSSPGSARRASSSDSTYSAKRSLASREFALGVEALERFVRREPLYRVHECVFGVLALESEPVDPRL
jgi:hypothetical protein